MVPFVLTTDTIQRSFDSCQMISLEVRMRKMALHISSSCNAELGSPDSKSMILKHYLMRNVLNSTFLCKFCCDKAKVKLDIAKGSLRIPVLL